MDNQANGEHNLIESLVSVLVNPLNDTVQDAHAAYHLKHFADIMPGGFFIYRADEEETLIYANEAMLRIFQCDTVQEFREMTGNSFRGIVHPDDLEAVEESIREQIAHSQYDLDYVEYRIIRKDGGVRWLDDYGHFVHSETVGDVFYVFVGDATEKKERQIEKLETWFSEKLKKEQELQAQLDKYDKEMKVIHQEHLIRLEMIEGLSVDYESIFYVDLDKDRIKAYRVSERFQKQFSEHCAVRTFTGFDADYIAEWVYPEDRELLKGISDPAYIRREFERSGNRNFHLNFRVYGNHHDTKYIQLRVVNVGSEESVSQVIFGYRNMDEEMIGEMQQKKLLKEALDEANLANNAKNLFLTNMSHDIRTPMNAIVGFTELARKHIQNQEKVANYLDMISTSSEQLLQLLNDVLEISRLESGAVNIEEEECSLMDIAHQVQMSILPKAAEKNITLSLDISNLKHDSVRADKGRLSQILTYLTDNAVKYTGADGRVTIVVIEKEQGGAQDDLVTYQFAIEDNGIGISEEFMSTLFEPFEREKNTTLSGIHGTGLGLTITKKLVDIIGGRIEVFSTAGEGSRFIVTLPLRLQESSGYFGTVEESVPQFSTAKRILIVDDNEINLEIEYEVLKDAGFLVDTAEDGSIAVEKIKQSKPGDYDLILMDIQMPIMDGYRATRAIREMKNPALAGIPIIAVSANAFEEDKRMAMESGMNAHLAKPLDTPRLYKLIRKFLKDK